MRGGRAAVWCGLVALLGCDEPAPSAVPGGRVVAVAEGPGPGVDLAGFCDHYTPTGASTPLTLPELDAPLSPMPDRPRWVNVWATWCKPCVEEIPRLVAWQQRMEAAGTPIDLVFVSVDLEAAAVERFRQEHPAMPASLRVADAQAFSAWLPVVGLPEGSPIPQHVYADSQGARRCVRAGAVSEADFSFLQALVERHR